MGFFSGFMKVFNKVAPFLRFVPVIGQFVTIAQLALNFINDIKTKGLKGALLGVATNLAGNMLGGALSALKDIKGPLTAGGFADIFMKSAKDTFSQFKDQVLGDMLKKNLDATLMDQVKSKLEQLGKDFLGDQSPLKSIALKALGLDPNDPASLAKVFPNATVLLNSLNTSLLTSATRDLYSLGVDRVTADEVRERIGATTYQGEVAPGNDLVPAQRVTPPVPGVPTYPLADMDPNKKYSA